MVGGPFAGTVIMAFGNVIAAIERFATFATQTQTQVTLMWNRGQITQIHAVLFAGGLVTISAEHITACVVIGQPRAIRVTFASVVIDTEIFVDLVIKRTAAVCLHSFGLTRHGYSMPVTCILGYACMKTYVGFEGFAKEFLLTLGYEVRSVCMYMYVF
jgi:hypothetical protein